MSHIESFVIGNMSCVTFHSLLCIGVWLRVMSYTHPGNVH
jgi:hypothetical protein